MTTTFDPIAYKTSTRRQWDEAADAWHRHGPLLADWLGPATELMLDMAGVSEGARVLDVAAGAGEQTLRAARRVGPSGHVLATDISPAILEHAAREARRAGVANVETLELDAERLDAIEDASFDAVVCRVGVIYLPDREGALAGFRRVLRAGGTVGLIVYSTAERNPFFSIPVSVIRRRAQLGSPAPGQPGPFSLGEPAQLTELLEQAGFREVQITAVDAPLCAPAATDCVRFERESFGALHQMMGGLDASERDATWEEIETRLREFESPDGFAGPCELLVAAARI